MRAARTDHVGLKAAVKIARLSARIHGLFIPEIWQRLESHVQAMNSAFQVCAPTVYARKE